MAQLAAFLLLALAVVCRSKVQANLNLTSRFVSWKIAGGSTAANGRYPYHVSIFDGERYLGGGSIINSSVVLTAAQCVYKHGVKTSYIKAGSNKLNSKVRRISITRIIIHEKYDGYPPLNDIALLITPEKSFKYGSKIKPIRLESDEVLPGNCVFAGWGTADMLGSYHNDLQHIKLKTITIDECKIKLQKTIDDTVICTLTKKGRGLCIGDGGSALVAKGKQIGIASYGEGMYCAHGNPDVFVKVSAFTEWINKKILENVSKD